LRQINQRERISEGFQGQRLIVLPPAVQARARVLPVVRDLYVTDVGHYPTAPGHYMHRPKGRPEAILIYCASGSGWCRVRNRKRTISQGSAVIIPAGEPHGYGADPVTPWSIYWVHFRGKRVSEYLEALGVSLSTPVMHAPDMPVISQAFEEVLSYTAHSPDDANLLGMSTSLGRLLGLLRHCQRAEDARESHGEKKVLESIQYMWNNLEKPCPLGLLAEQVHLSVSHFCHLFRKHTRTSPSVFMTRLKMQKACQLLVTMDRSVAEVAQALGYEDPFYFSRAFKKVNGISPVHYRNRLLEHSPKGQSPGV
jgi:AraC-like DNA-binding protein/quercetin dioxygenase-like cupin family protein